MIPHISSMPDERLGMIMVEGLSLGNPVQLGAPLAFGFIVSIVDRGILVKSVAGPVVRGTVLISVLLLLALTTSRAAWLMAAVGLLAVILVDRRSRVRGLAGLAIALVAFQVILLTPLGDPLQKGLDRTFGEGRSVRQRSTGRTDQWKVAYGAFFDSPVTILLGHGPGSGAKMYAKFSQRIKGISFRVGFPMGFHSLAMHLGVELGLSGLVPLFLMIGTAGIRIASGVRRSRLVFPLAIFLAYLILIATVPGLDVVSGLFLGLALLGTLRPALALPVGVKK
jgi:O-antigen ligase